MSWLDYSADRYTPICLSTPFFEAPFLIIAEKMNFQLHKMIYFICSMTCKVGYMFKEAIVDLKSYNKNRINYGEIFAEYQEILIFLCVKFFLNMKQ